MLAPWWHTALLVFILLLASVNGSRAAHLLSATHSKLPQYFRGIAWEWILVGFTWLGVRKALSTEQKAQAAESFGAEGQFLSAAKKLLDTTHPAFRSVSSVRS